MNNKLKNTLIIAGIILLIAGVYILKQWKVNDKNEENISNTQNIVQTNTKYTLYNFGYDGCYYCEVMEPIFEKYSNSYENISFQTIDIYEDEEIANKYNVQYTPTFVIVDGEGKAIERKVGAMSDVQFKTFVEKYK